MSSAHFSVECSASGCHVTDLKSSNGTLLNGERLSTAALRHGDTIAAGETTFVLRLEGDAAALGREEPSPAAEATPQDRLLYMLRRDFQPLYAILDAARDSKILALLLHSNEEYQSLYEGEEGAKLAQVAPYLVRLKNDSPLLEKLVREGWGESWGVYLTSRSEPVEVRHHLRHFLQVRMPDGKQVYFRFYDPRVLRIYLPTCTAEETGSFFGPIQNYLMEDEDANSLLHIVNSGRGVRSTQIPLANPTPMVDNQNPFHGERPDSSLR